MVLILTTKCKREEKTKSVQPRIPFNSGYLTLFLTLFLLIFLISITSSTKAQNPDRIIAISTNEDGKPGNNDSVVVSISSDGRFIVYTSLADNLVNNDTNDSNDLFVYDRLWDETIRPVESIIGAKASANGRILSYTKEDVFVSSHIIDMLTGDTQTISVNFWGEEANGHSWIDSLSFDGRFGTVITTADNLFPHDSNGKNSDALLYDRVNDQVQIISSVKSGTTGNDASPLSVISDDGRTIAYLTYASDLLGNENTKGLIFYDRVLGVSSVLNIPITENDEVELLTDIDISRSGNKLVYLLQHSNSNEFQGHVTVLDRRTNKKEVIFQFNTNKEDFSEQTTGLALSGNGEFLALVYPFEAESKILSRLNLNTGERIIIDQGSIGSTVDLSEDGGLIAYSKEIDGISQIYIWNETLEDTPFYVLAGRIIDSTGHPLALVNLHDDRGNTTRTDGEGFFWINGLQPGEISLKPEKDGFEFEPKEFKIDLKSDKRDLLIIYTHKELLEEAEKDLGMPYSQNRGEIGPFHGYNAGYCTDLILDAFTWGVNFNIQFALEMDFKANPWHLYRWRDARDAQDMWRFFSYTGQIQNHESAYQPGDIIFFDWSQDGEIDHVAMVSEVNSRNRPLMMYDATGKINSNPSGLAKELPWENFHEETVRGFARWSGKYQSIIPILPPGEVIQTALGGADLSFRLLDTTGRSISKIENDITGGRYENWIWEQSISLYSPNLDPKYFLVIISNEGDINQPYSYTAQFIRDGLVKGRIEFKGKIPDGQIIRIPIHLNIGIDTIELGNTNQRVEGSLNFGNN
jgi:hypothetical protein